MIGIGILVTAVFVVCFAPAKSAGMADRRLEEIQRLSARREEGVLDGN